MSSPKGTLAVAVAAAILLSLALPAAGAGPAGPGADDRLAQQVDADSVRMTAALQPNGDARWTVTYRVRLDDENETAAFESLQDDVEDDPDNYTARFADRMRATAAAAENETGREMAVRNVTVDARTQSVPSYGILEYMFLWTNFAVADGDTIRAGDAVAGLFLDRQTTFVVRWPSGYGLETVRPEPTPELRENRSLGWAGPREFAGDEPRVVVSESAGSPGGDGGDGLPLGMLAGAFVVAIALAAGALWYRRDGADEDGGTTGVAATGADEEDPPEALMSNEEKVLKLVRDRGGRIKQQEIVEAFDWTEAKTSQVVRDLRDEGDLEGFRLGRENVLRLPEKGEDVDEEADGGE